MPTRPAATGCRLAIAVNGLALLALLAASSTASAEPPITSPQDAACRALARSRVFSTPDPMNLGLHEIGRRIYDGCMRSTGRASGHARRRHSRRRR